jgi:hypothetical protein
MIRRFAKRFLTPPLVVLAACVMFFEEWLWNRVTKLMAWVGRWPLFHRFEEHLAALPPYGALIVMVLPGTLLLPVKLGALYLIAHGHAMQGIGVILAAKVIGTAVVARMFAICYDSLMKIGWLKRLTEGVLWLKSWLYARIKTMPGWDFAVRTKHRIKQWLSKLRKDGLRRRFLAIKRWLKRPAPVVSPVVPPPSGNNSDPL